MGIVHLNIQGIHCLYNIVPVITHLPCQGCLALDCCLNTRLNSHPWNLLVLFPERQYSAAASQAFRLVVLFGTMDLQLVTCVSIQCVFLYCFLYFLLFGERCAYSTVDIVGGFLYVMKYHVKYMNWHKLATGMTNQLYMAT